MSKLGYNGTMTEGDTQSVTFQFQTTGTTPWDGLTRLGTSEARDRTSSFQAVSWLSATRPCGIQEAIVDPGANGTFVFQMTAPSVATLLTFIESFGVVREGEWLGLDQNRLTINVMPEGMSGDEIIIIESRSGGQNFAWYSDTGMADSGTQCTAPGLTSGIGSRYGSTYRSVVGLKKAQFTPYFAAEKEYNVYVAWGDGSNRRDNITYRVVHADGEATTLVNQGATANEWHHLGQFRFAAGNGGYVEMTNESVDLSGSMFASGAKFEPVPDTGVETWDLY